MLLLRQLEFAFRNTDTLSVARVGNPGAAISDRGYKKPGVSPGGFAGRIPAVPPAETEMTQLLRGADSALEEKARTLLRANGAGRIATEIRVEWNSRLKTCAGRADYRQRLISLNPQLIHHPVELDRTFRHELAHLLAQFRAGRHRILPHGVEWRRACHNLEIGDEKRCHNLPFPVKNYRRRFVYRCPNCRRNFPRAHRVRRAVACLACCRAHNHGEFAARFRLQLVEEACCSL